MASEFVAKESLAVGRTRNPDCEGGGIRQAGAGDWGGWDVGKIFALTTPLVLLVQLRLGKNELLATCAHPVAEDIFVSRCKQQIESTSHSAVEFLIHLLN